MRLKMKSTELDRLKALKRRDKERTSQTAKEQAEVRLRLSQIKASLIHFAEYQRQSKKDQIGNVCDNHK